MMVHSEFGDFEMIWMIFTLLINLLKWNTLLKTTFACVNRSKPSKSKTKYPNLTSEILISYHFKTISNRFRTNFKPFRSFSTSLTLFTQFWVNSAHSCRGKTRNFRLSLRSFKLSELPKMGYWIAHKDYQRFEN